MKRYSIPSKNKFAVAALAILSQDEKFHFTYSILIEWCLMPFITLSELYLGSKFISPCFPGALSPTTPNKILSKLLACIPT